MFNDGFGPFVWFGHFFGMAVMGIFCLVAFAIAIGLIFLLVRFLLVATTAAQLYISKNAPAATSTTSAATKPATTAAAKPPTKPAAQP